MDSQNLLFNAALAGVFATLFIFYYLSRKSRAFKGKAAPRPSGSWPIIGHLPLLAGPQLPHKTFGAIADKLGPIFSLQLGVHQALVISSWEIAKELFTTNDTAVSSRPPFKAAKHLGYNYAMFAFSPYGEYWRDIRKITTLELLSNRRLELLKHVKISEVETSLKELYKLWEQKKNESGSVEVDLRKWFGGISVNVIVRMIAGKKAYGDSNVRDEKLAVQCQNEIRELYKHLGKFVLRDAVPLPDWVDFGGHEKAMKKTAKVLDVVIGQWLEEHKEKRQIGETQIKGEQDFMDVMLSVLDGKDLAGYDSDTICKATSLAMIAGGTDTTIVTMTWAISLLLNNRHALVKAQKELDDCVGRERLVKDTDISKLVYLQAIVKETLRLYPPAPLSAPRQFIEDCTIGGYRVTKGTWLMVNLWKIHTDSRVWPNPFEFKPERFLTTNKDVDVKGQHFQLIPFGSGRRICPGISFALQIVHLALASFIHAFEISTANDTPVDMTESAGMTNLKATPLEVLISPRLSVHLYELIG